MMDGHVRKLADDLESMKKARFEDNKPKCPPDHPNTPLKISNGRRAPAEFSWKTSKPPRRNSRKSPPETAALEKAGPRRLEMTGIKIFRRTGIYGRKGL
jgi:hypothetical protein